ncbi:RloB domain-containing protein [Streptomyces sp. NPDC058470]|uniref:RloB domain-containing protein n=1 Tax=Streptomyces sp. NPDC058470 TaxID=3346515 RepID=UPI00366936AE
MLLRCRVANVRSLRDEQELSFVVPQGEGLWCLFDRDRHEDIPTAFARARKAELHVAYSHPCFELWRQSPNPQ